ncbi:nuclear transport factor 2 family protein [Dyadobacter flavalbus]|uniref:Nuclear transport factor 2 family protein n=1 Tax=Dyadobacter flavalbus TaxID=2579942 RepID=A0A5M8R057_9BACT|nr:nuclear transport factor 2 family protein [Dyadobacter flavalbus]KAA6441847.1 nuclear transport factor 2 family protein [Dyadobacter flavalbus]
MLIANVAKAQETANVRKTVDLLFDGMRTGDSTLLRKVFNPGCSLTSFSRNEKDSVVIHRSDAESFIKAAGKPHKEIWDEKIYDVKILVDDMTATAWAPYKFYLGDTFSHCGVNVFSMIKTKSGWKIYEIKDTRRKTACL